ncbi:MAG: tetratricopeptide repeat protein [Bacteroidales bacterium]|nr:tetratricopeptide repeat protein [Bacteroidales bacterium]
MRAISKILLTTSLCMLPTMHKAQTTASQNVVKAVEKVYNEELQENAQDYNVYFRRAHLYYGQNQYMRALSDIDNAIKYTPADDEDMLSQEYALRANIYIMTGRKEEALADIDKALEYDRTSYALIYQKANLNFELGNYSVAKENFQRLNRLHNRSLEALIGLARVAVKENNLGLANEYVDEAVAFYPAESEAYLRRASVRELMGNNTGAVDDMILAIAVDKNSGKAISELVGMSNKDYNAVISGLSNAISQAPDVGIYYYIRAMIAQAHYHYIAAIGDYKTIIDKKLYNYHGIHAKLAECYYALCDYTSALDQINIALGSARNSGYYITSSKIYLAIGNVEMAQLYAERALEGDLNNQLAQNQMAMVKLASGEYADASDRFGESIINNPEHPINYIIRAWIMSEKLKKPSDAVGFLTRCLSLEYADTDYRSYLGFALNLMGEDEQATIWIDNLMASKPADIDGRIHYLAAAMYSQLGDFEKAFDSMQQALERGYSNLYDWRKYDVANLSVAPLRSDARFEAMLGSYDYLFK